MAVEEEIATPLFAHESFGEYEFVDDGLDHEYYFGKKPKSPTSLLSDSGCSLESVDVDDPTLERFPSDRSSVMDTLRKIRSSTDEGRSGLEDGQHSTPATSRKTSVDSSDGMMGQLSPTSTRKRDNRSSRSSFGRPISAVSLSCIDEEPRTLGDAGPGSKYDAEAKAGGANGEGSTTDEDTGLVMKATKA
jgi:ATP-dependent RNA helicase MRH4